MPTNRLSKDELALLTEVVSERLPCLSHLVAQAAKGCVGPEQREALRSVVLDEFLRELKHDYEPTARGIRLDSLIGALEKVSPLQDRDIDETLVENILSCNEQRQRTELPPNDLKEVIRRMQGAVSEMAGRPLPLSEANNRFTKVAAIDSSIAGEVNSLIGDLANATERDLRKAALVNRLRSLVESENDEFASYFRAWLEIVELTPE